MKKTLKLIIPVMVIMFSMAQASYACGGEGKQCKKKKAKTEKSCSKDCEKECCSKKEDKGAEEK